MLRLVEFSERHAFGHYQRHMVNPDDVMALSEHRDSREVTIRLRDGSTVLATGTLEEVRTKLEGEPMMQGGERGAGE